MAITLPDARQLSDEVLEALRLRAVHGCELGFTEADVADLLGMSRETVSRLWSAYARRGPDALPGDRTGRPVGNGLPEWPAYSADRRATMVLDNNPRVEIDPAAELRHFWLEEEKRQRPGARG